VTGGQVLFVGVVLLFRYLEAILQTNLIPLMSNHAHYFTLDFAATGAKLS